MYEPHQAERRLQTAAALLLGAAALIGIVLRAGVHRVFLPGWWRF
jgi:hypothetical protein